MAVQALGELKTCRAVEGLIPLLNDDRGLCRVWAARALRKITGQDFEENPAKWQEWWEKNKEKYK